MTDVLAEHRFLISTLLGGLGILVLLVVIAQRLSRRAGGWRAVRRGMRREIALTARAFAWPVLRWFRYVKRLGQLSRLLRDPLSWLDAERAIRHTASVLPASACRPYAVLVGPAMVGVQFAGRLPPIAVEPWIADEDDPRLWWTPRSAVPDQRRGIWPMLVSIGLHDAYQEGYAVLLDLAACPGLTAVVGHARTAPPLLHAIAAQLDDRLPAGSVIVADGTHARFAGPPPGAVVRAAQARAEAGRPVFAVCAELPIVPAGEVAEPRPDLDDFAALTHSGERAGLRLLVGGGARGQVRLLVAEVDGIVRVVGTPLTVDIAPLPRAVARVIGAMPRLQPHEVSPPHLSDVDELAEPAPGSVGVSVMYGAGFGAEQVRMSTMEKAVS